MNLLSGTIGITKALAIGSAILFSQLGQSGLALAESKMRVLAQRAAIVDVGNEKCGDMFISNIEMAAALRAAWSVASATQDANELKTSYVSEQKFF